MLEMSPNPQDIKPGYIYVLIHPSDSQLFKVGMTTQPPEKRLAQHNSNFEKAAGRIVKQTGQKWELKKFYKVKNPRYVEKKFWGEIRNPDIPFHSREEIERTSWGVVKDALDVALKADHLPEKVATDQEQANHVYAYSARMRRRLQGRGITLLTYVKSLISGKADFKCENGHVWRARPKDVGEGLGCPVCGVGYEDADMIIQRIVAGHVVLLIHPEKPGYIKIGLCRGNLFENSETSLWDGWQVYRYRYCEELGLADKIVWNLIGLPKDHENGQVKVDLEFAEEVFRKLTDVIYEKVGELERDLERNGEIPLLIPLGRRPPVLASANV